MGDPFSVAASVAGVISLGAATTKLFYQFIASIIDAPREVQAITSSLYSVNIALCQIQTLLLDLTYASETATEDLEDLDKSVLCCVSCFNLIENWLRSVCPDPTDNHSTAKRAWQQVKYVFQKDSLREALERLENEKGTLRLIMSALNSKFTTQALKVVKNAERAVRRNTQIIKRLELRITRVLQDAIGRSLETTSSVSLDSICTQAEIERLLTDSGSALSLTLTDVCNDSASVIIIPDSLSGVDSMSARIEFSSTNLEPIYDSQFEDNIAPGERGSNEAVTKVAEDINRPVKVKTSNQLRIGSSFSLANTIGTSGAPHSAIVTEEQGEEQDLREPEGDDRPVGNIEKKGALLVTHQIMHDLGSNRLAKPTTNKIKRSTVGDLFRRVMASPPNAILDGGLKVAVEMYRELKLSSELLMSNLENSGRCIERFAFYEESFRGVVIGSSNADRYLKSCFKNAEEAIRNYTDYARITYPESWKKSSLVQTLRGSLTSPHFQELWEKVDASMNELDRTISLQLMLEQRERTETSITAHRRLEETAINTYLSQQEVLQVHGNLESKVEATHLLVAMAMSKMEGKRRGTRRKRQRSRRNGAEGETSKVAKPGKDGTENIKAESGRELGYEASLGNSEKSFHASVEDWETSNEEES